MRKYGDSPPDNSLSTKNPTTDQLTLGLTENQQVTFLFFKNDKYIHAPWMEPCLSDETLLKDLPKKIKNTFSSPMTK
jgi:hypothetical protein